MIFKVRFEESDCIASTRINVQNQKLSVNFGEVITVADLPHYAGEYTVTPKTSSQTLETRDRVMTENLTVGKIPYFEVTNTANGKTVTIA